MSFAYNTCAKAALLYKKCEGDFVVLFEIGQGPLNSLSAWMFLFPNEILLLILLGNFEMNVFKT